MENKIEEVECCPMFRPELWDNKKIKWENKNFIKDKVCTFLHIPLNFSKIITKMIRKTEESNASTSESLCLTEHSSKWNMNIYLETLKEINEYENIRLSGNFFSKVYEGKYNNIGKWKKDFENEIYKQNKTSKNIYFWYTTCPKCAKKYGKNYVVIIAKIE